MTINPPIDQIPGGYSYRKSMNTDSEEVKELIFNTLLEYGLTPEPNSTDQDLSNLDVNYREGFFGLVEDGSKIVATFALLPIAENIVEIRKMYALKAIRGKGLGKWMVNYLLQIAQENGYEEVELETASPLKEAIYLYEKMGFTEKKFENKTPRCDKAFHLKLK